MTCARCRAEVPDGSQFCNHCGAATGGPINVSPVNSTERRLLASNRATPILITLLLALGSLVLYQVLKSPPGVRAPIGNGTPSVTPDAGPEPSREPPRTSSDSSMKSALTPAEFTIGPAGLRQFKILGDQRTRNASLVGRFSASGGAYNDIEVFVIGTDSSMNPGEGIYSKALYWSRRVSTRELDVPLSSGEYYLVFSNTWSPSIKTVSAQVSLQSQP